MSSSALHQLHDDELIKRYQSDQQSDILGVLYERYAHLVYGVCMKYLKNQEDAKDATMQIFEKLIQDLHKHEIIYFKAWLYKVAQNHCLMQLRQRTYITYTEEFTAAPVEFMNPLHPKQLEEIQFEKMEQALHLLPPEQRQCIDLFYLQKKSYVEIMQQTGFTFMQVKSFIQNGKRNLKNKMSL